MSKGRNAFALKKFEIIFSDFMGYGTNFSEYFEDVEKSRLFEHYDFSQESYKTEKTVEIILNWAYHYIDGNLDEAEKIREQLRSVHHFIERIDRHIKRLSVGSFCRMERQKELIASYDSIVNLLIDFEEAALRDYKRIFRRLSEEFSRKLGERLRNARYLKGLSQDAVSREIGIGQNTLSRYEKGMHEAPAYVVLRLAKLYGISTNYLFGLSDNLI